MWMRFAARGAAAAGAVPTNMRDEQQDRRPEAASARPYPFAGRRRAAQRTTVPVDGSRCATVRGAGRRARPAADRGMRRERGPGAAAGRRRRHERAGPVAGRTSLDRSKAARARSAAAAARRHAELGRLRGVRSVGAALRRARLSGAIGRGAYRRYRAAYDGARAAAARLPGARGVEERAVLGSVETLADALALTPSRFPAVFLNLRRNTRTWTRGAVPRGRRAAHVRPQPGRVPVRARAGHAAAPARHLGPDQRRPAPLPRPRTARAAAAARCGARSTAPPGSPPSAAASARGSTSTATPRAPRRGSAGWRRRPPSRRSPGPRAPSARRATRSSPARRSARSRPRRRPASPCPPPRAASATSCTRSRRRCRSSTASCRR